MNSRRSVDRFSSYFLLSYPCAPGCFFVRQIHLWGSRLLPFRFTLPIRGEYGLHIPKGVDDDDDSNVLMEGGSDDTVQKNVGIFNTAVNETNSTFHATSLVSNMKEALRR